jgi:hypothetical protein
MDDFGSGTFLSGLIAAVANNKEGIAGVSTGKVLAVKVLDSGSGGTAYDVARGMAYCADQASVSVVLVAWTGRDSLTLSSAVNHLVVDKGKLLVAAAGDNSTSAPTNSFPAAYSSSFGGVVAVAASGLDNGSTVNYDCRSAFSNYGGWITLVAPGTQILSTAPWHRPTTFAPDYQKWGGTPAAAAFVAGAAARVWGYLPADSAVQVVQRLKDKGKSLAINGSCWPLSMPATLKSINVASAMDRGAMVAFVNDALTGQPLSGAKVTVYDAVTHAQVGSAEIPSTATLDALTNTVSAFPNQADVLNIPVASLDQMFVAKVSAANYTASPQNPFLGAESALVNPDGTFPLIVGQYGVYVRGYVPPKSANFTIVGASIALNPSELAVWVPSPPAPANFIVSPHYYLPTSNPVLLPFGSMITDPYARWVRGDGYSFQTILIHNRSKSPANTAAPWYTGSYTVGMTDGNTSGTNYLDDANVSVLVWKDGVIKQRVDKGTYTCDTSKHWWFPMQITTASSGSGPVTYSAYAPACGTINNAPYHP